MTFSAQVKEEVEKLKVWDNNSTLKQDEQIKRLQIRQAFMKCGSINDPNKKYHLELVFKSMEKAEQIKKLLIESGINAKTTVKRNNYVVYLKSGDDIANFLALIGARLTVMKFEDIRVLKEKRNDVNRTVNCENANLDKIIKASLQQIEAINYLVEKDKIKELPEKLREIAYLRKKNPDASLAELGAMLKKPIGKSGTKHRLEKIIEIAENYKNN